ASVTKTAPLEVLTFDPVAPVVAFTCPTSGALAPANRAMTVSATATGTAAISKVEFCVDAAPTPFATDTTSPYSVSYTVPAGLTDGTPFGLRAKASDAAGYTAETSSLVTVVAGDTISANTTIGPSDASHEGHTVIITGGTTTIQGSHAFARLVVLSA